MKKSKIVLNMIVLFAVLVVFTVPAVIAQEDTVYFVPQHGTIEGGPCNNITVDVWVSTTSGFDNWGTDIAFDPTCINITNVTYPAGWMSTGFGIPSSGRVRIGNFRLSCTTGNPEILATLTIHCEAWDCTSPLNFTAGLVPSYIKCIANPCSVDWINGTVTNEAPTPTLVVYTISNRTITPPQTTEIDVEFSERVKWKIAIEDGGVVYDWTGTSKNPNSRTWDGTYETTDTIVPDGVYYVNVTGTNTTTGLSVVNDTETITVTSAKEPVLTTITVKPETATLNVSETQQFTATAKDQFDNAMSGIAFEWSSSNEAVGTIDANGLFTALADGDTMVKAENGTVNGTAEVTVTSGAPDIISFAPASPISDNEGEPRTFNITIDQTVNVSWLINGTEVFNQSGVTFSEYTNASAVIGTRNVSAFVENPNGTDMQSWIWKVTEAGAVPTADYLEIEDASGSSGTYVAVPVSITNVINGPVQGIRLRVDYNESVLNLMNISNGDLTLTWTRLQLGGDRHTMIIATAYIGDAIPNGSTGSIVLLNFSVIGSPGDTSPMNMSVIELSNPAGIVGTAPARNGTFVISELSSIVGRITYACNGTGIAGAKVNLTKGSIVNTTVTNETGYYNFTDIIPGSYFVNASKPGFYDNSTEVNVIAGEAITADMMLWLKGDLNNDCEIADAGDVVLMLRASVMDIFGDTRYDLNGNGEIADAGDVVLMLRASVSDIELL
jgi:hypothetical protein